MQQAKGLVPSAGDDGIERLFVHRHALGVEQSSVAHDGEHLQPVVALLRRALRPSLSQALADGERKTGAWFARHRMAVVPFADLPDAFVNLNSPAELAAWEARLRERGAP